MNQTQFPNASPMKPVMNDTIYTNIQPNDVDLVTTRVGSGPADIETGAVVGSKATMVPPHDRNAREVVDRSVAVPFRVWVVLFISSVGVLLASISTTVLVIAFPTLLLELRTTISMMLWIILVLNLVVAASVSIAGKLGDIFGQAMMYRFGYLAFTVGCLVSGFAKMKNEGNDLLAGRVVTGFGAAFLFTNSSAILTGAFAPYGKVGLAQGIFQLAVAFGMILGPVVGGGFAQTNWRWIFWWNVPVAGFCFLLSLWAVKETHPPLPLPWLDHLRCFDWIGAILYPLSLTLIFMALFQAVEPIYGLDRDGPLAGLVVGGVLAFIFFFINEFYAIDPMVPPVMFTQNKIFTVSTIAGTLVAFARYSITFNMIFYLQGPKIKTPLQAGIALIPFGIGVMFTGFFAGALADRFGVRKMTIIGPLIALLACGIVLTYTENSSDGDIGGILFVAGMGIGLFGSPNNMSNMLSVQPLQRGAAAAIGMATMMITSILAIALTFGLILHSMTPIQLLLLFIVPGNRLDQATINKFLRNINIDYYVVMGALFLASVFCIFNDFKADSGKNVKAARTHQEFIETPATTGDVPPAMTFIGSKEAADYADVNVPAVYVGDKGNRIDGIDEEAKEAPSSVH
jgi:MFS family permease